MAHGRELVAQGADLLDVGGESTRPGRGAAEPGGGAAPRPPRRRGAERPGARCRSTRCAPRSPPRRSMPAPPSSTTSAAGSPTPRWPRWSRERGGAVRRHALARAQPRRCRTAAHYDDVVADVRARAGRAGRGAASPPGCGRSRRARPRLRASPSAPSTTGRCSRRLDEVVALGHRARRRHVAQDASSAPWAAPPTTEPGRRWSATSSPRPRPCTSPGTASGACGCTTSSATVDALDVVEALRRHVGSRARERRRPATASGCPGVRGRGFHGVFEHERREGQEFVVDVELAVDLAPAGASDDLADTVNYGEIGAAALARIEGEPYDLIERLAELVAPGRPRARRGRRGHRHGAQAAGAGGGAVRRRHGHGDPSPRPRCPSSSPSGRTCPAAGSDPQDTAPGRARGARASTRTSPVVAVVRAARHRAGRRARAARLRQRRRHGPHRAVAHVAAARAARHRGGVRPPPRGAVGRAHPRPRPRAVRRPGIRHRRHLRRCRG